MDTNESEVKRLEFMYREKEILALVFGHVAARHCGEAKLCDQERADQVCLVVADFSFREVRYENTPVDWLETTSPRWLEPFQNWIETAKNLSRNNSVEIA